jgi:hypothetical protein
LGSSITIAAQDTPITGARLTLVEKSEPALTVTLENLRDVPLVAWETATLHEDSTQPATVSFQDRRSTQGNASENGAVPPRGRLVQTMEVGNRDAIAAIMHLAIFADGYYEGPGGDSYLQRSREESEELRYWIQALRSIALAPDSDMQRTLNERLAERGSEIKYLTTVAALRYLRDEIEAGSAASFRSALAARMTEMQERLAILDRPMIPGPLQRSSDVPSVQITSTPSTTTRLYGIVENLRDIPIEAFGLQQYQGGSGRLRGGLTFCGVSIQPGERHEVELTWLNNPDGSLPNVKLHSIMFEDLRFEGSSAGRSRCLGASTKQEKREK